MRKDIFLQLLWRILAMVLFGTVDGKILKILVCDKVFFQIWLSGAIIWKT